MNEISMPVSYTHLDVYKRQDIKLGKPTRDKYIENYCENIRRVAEAGIKCICYNFMPVFDWTRTQLDHVLADGSTSLVYYQEPVSYTHLFKGGGGYQTSVVLFICSRSCKCSFEPVFCNTAGNGRRWRWLGNRYF